MPIRFGTSGWRGIIADDYTFDAVRRCAQALADYLNARPIPSRTIVVAHDCRFMARRFAETTCRVLAGNGFEPLLTDRDAPTPVLAFHIVRQQAAGGVNITASHNPAEYCGFKYSTPNGAVATEEVTGVLEDIIAGLQEIKQAPRDYTPRTFDPRPDYLDAIRKLVDFSLLRKNRGLAILDLLHGTGRGYLDALVAEAGWETVVLHANLDPIFGGHHPEPNAERLAEVSRLVRSRNAKIGLAVDGDADRFGIVDSDGTWLAPNQVLPLTLYHLKKNRGWTGAVVRTVPTSHMVDAVAGMLGVEVHETPVGFKYIGNLMEKQPIIVGGEESGGLSVKGHVLDKDGVLACLLMCELVSAEGKSLGQILRDLERQIGSFVTDRINARLTPEAKDALMKKLASGPAEIAGRRVREFITKDGFKFVFDDGTWLAFRASGTEPLVRCYIEAHSAAQRDEMKRAAQALMG
jgi:alpha-D-glucose phosphate-specific phosphoglucomutase